MSFLQILGELTPMASQAKTDLIRKEIIDFEFMGSRNETAESRSVTSRCRVREKMRRDIEAFLARGGHIRQIEPNVMADPPRKPQSHYGNRLV